MISGRKALETIERTLADEASAVSALEDRLEALQKQTEEARAAELSGYRDLAGLRLEAIDRDSLTGGLDRADKDALALLAQRDAARQAAQTRRAELVQRLEDLDARRASQEADVAAARAAVERAETETRARLEKDPAFSAQEDRAHKIDIQATNAGEKANQSETELAEKRAAYEQSPLFMYLWTRGFGLPGYAAMPLIRTLDGWVAGLIGYDAARRDFGRLQEIPKRLRGHADRLAEEAAAEEEALSELWQKARAEDGLTPLDDALEAAEAALEQTEDARDALAQQHEDLLAELASFASGADEWSLQAVDLIAGELRRQNVEALFQDAQETLGAEDDRIVGRLMESQGEIAALHAARVELKERLDQRLARLKELGEIARDFKRRRYARSNSTFRDGDLIAVLLQNLLEGTLSRNGFWDHLSRQHRVLRSTMRTHRARRSRSAGGGFRTGGGFGGGRSAGGGFSTGGGF
ncbi:hypothetical protein ACQ5SP_08265 [Rhodovulum sp. YNF3179]|uniref:hypothetical protein n=1 Tax=Rhodovulum sp. YNF3179 TaxID=3425127 RepID=UPI003D34094B